MCQCVSDACEKMCKKHHIIDTTTKNKDTALFIVLFHGLMQLAVHNRVNIIMVTVHYIIHIIPHVLQGK